MGQADFFRHVVERDGASVLALDLPPGKHQPTRLKDNVNFSATRCGASESRADVVEIENSHELESESFQCQPGDMPILRYEFIQNGRNRFLQERPKLPAHQLFDLFQKRSDYFRDEFLSSANQEGL